MNASSQTPSTAPTVLPLHEAPLSTVFVDRDGDEWVPSGHTAGGELLLSCPEPQDPEDQGEGESHEWTLHKVQTAFGPLMAQSAVAR